MHCLGHRTVILSTSILSTSILFRSQGVTWLCQNETLIR